MGMIQEFKTFAVKGNAMDMAVGIIIGAAFGKIVNSLVADIIMPPIGLLMRGVDFSNQYLPLNPQEGQSFATPAAAAEAGVVTLNYGLFINALINFLIVAWAVFLLIKGLNSLQRKADKEPDKAPEPSQDIVLLTEIRDALTKR